jgi:hypothetical protein
VSAKIQDSGLIIGVEAPGETKPIGNASQDGSTADGRMLSVIKLEARDQLEPGRWLLVGDQFQQFEEG